MDQRILNPGEYVVVTSENIETLLKWRFEGDHLKAKENNWLRIGWLVGLSLLNWGIGVDHNPDRGDNDMFFNKELTMEEFCKKTNIIHETEYSVWYNFNKIVS